jgi:4'-phosphopantetheinyl transferase
MISAEIFWLRDTPGTELGDFIHLLAPEEKIELAGFRHAPRQRSFILSRTLLRHVLAEKLAVAKSAIRFSRTPTGRLALGNASTWQFSLSHAAGLVAVIVAQADCGIDIEAARPLAFTRIAQRYFSKIENNWLAHGDAALREREFFKLWTLKEATAKALHQGLAHNLSRLAFDVSGPEPCLIDTTLGLQVFQSHADDIFISGAIKTAATVSWRIQDMQLTDL